MWPCMAMRIVECFRGSGRFLPLLAACAIVAFDVSCGPTSDLPGTALGTYNVSGTLGTNTCGSGLGAPNPWTFTAQMSEDGTTLYWEPSGGTALSNVMTSTTEVTLSSTETANVDATDAGVEGACDLTSTTAVQLTLAPGSPPASFTGSIVYTFAAATGVSSTNDCTDQLSASGGSYDTLPCTTTYSISASHQ
jgi:hypothetical protein